MTAYVRSYVSGPVLSKQPLQFYKVLQTDMYTFQISRARKSCNAFKHDLTSFQSEINHVLHVAAMACFIYMSKSKSAYLSATAKCSSILKVSLCLISQGKTFIQYSFTQTLFTQTRYSLSWWGRLMYLFCFALFTNILKNLSRIFETF